MKDTNKVSCTKELLTLANNIEYYNKQIYELLNKEVNLNTAKVGISDEGDRDMDIQLACLVAGIATNEWIQDCLNNYRILIQKANLGLMPTVAKGDNLYAESKSKESTAESAEVEPDDIPF